VLNHRARTGIDTFTHRGSAGDEPTWVDIRGTCRVTDLSTGLTEDDVYFHLEVVDNGEPGGKDNPVNVRDESKHGDWIIMFVGEGEDEYISWDQRGEGDPLGQHINGGNIIHMGQEAQP